ncbi:hypothetical protein F5X97DRAFT_244295 [Nemania serpens]|nr:hypothetical protein F5X97DRAFT_244295 [Nemania serpens]
MANFPNLRRLFIDARSDDEEREVSRRAVVLQCGLVHGLSRRLQLDSSADEWYKIARCDRVMAAI